MKLVNTAMRDTIASNYNPFLLNKEITDVIPKAFVSTTMAAIANLYI